MELQYNIYFGISALVFMIILVIYSQITYSMESKRNREFYRLAIYVLIADILNVVQLDIHVNREDIVREEY